MEEYAIYGLKAESTSLLDYGEKCEQNNIFQDLLNSFKGSTSNEQDRQEINFNKSEYSSRTQCADKERLYRNIMKVGYLYNNVVVFLEKQNKSMVAEGLSKIVKLYLDDCSKDLADASTQKSILRKCDTGEDLITKRWALVWSRKASEPLEYILKILIATQGLPSSAMLDVILQYFPHGNPRLSTVAHDIYCGAAESFCKMLWFWIVMGVLNDPYEEFFIRKSESYSKYDCWGKKYFYREQLIPKFLPLYTAKLIFEGGKMISFILIHFEGIGPDSKSRKVFLDLQNEPHCGLLELFSGGQTYLHNQIENMCMEYSENILNVLKDNFNLARYFKGVYWYVFLTLGNFGRYFLELIYPLYYSQVEYLEIQTIKCLLKNSVVSTSPFHRNKVKWIEAEYVTENWKNLVKNDKLCDVLIINYDRGNPISKLFSPFDSTHDELNSIIWKLQHMQYSLSYQRNVLVHLAKTICFEQKMKQVWELIFELISTLCQFVSQVNFYVMNDIIEKEWQEFWKCYSEAQTIDTVINVYGRLLTNVSHSFADNTNKEMNVSLNFFHDVTIDSEQLVNAMEQALIHDNGLISADELQAKISILKINFQDGIRKLLRNVSPNSHDENLIHLCDRINFNGFYK